MFRIKSQLTLKNSKMFFVLFQLIIVFFIGVSTKIVNSNNGKIEGYKTQTITGKDFYAFEGIPYAEPPIGENRFEEPIPKKSWNGTWVANNLYTCLQLYHSPDTENYPVIGDEDCLYLNVYTPIDLNVTKKDLYNVIVFIHGGAFMFNSGGTYGPKYILERENIIYVSLNYRLGPLGFLSTQDEVQPGNLGIKDQILALKWIKSNIKFFNGNSNSITLTGMSAGGASVHLHYMSQLSKGLFNRGIAQSGTALNPWVLAENSKQKAFKLGEILGCSTSKSFELIQCLKSRNSYQIVQAVKHFQKFLYNPISPFGVVIDGLWSKTPVLSDHPYTLLKNGQIEDLPLIFSQVGAEGLYPGADFLRNHSLKHLGENLNLLLPYILEYKDTADANDLDGVTQKIRNFYLGEKKLSEETFSLLIKMISDRLFIVDIEKSVKLHSKNSNSSVYYYIFNYRGAKSKSELRTGPNFNFGVSHADDTVYVLYSNLDMRSNEMDEKMSQLFLDMWLNFANIGNPNIANVDWIPMDKNLESNLKYLYIESPEIIGMKENGTLGNSEFWNSLNIKENERLNV
ncbi:venom carboxylesterase-6-like [Onthophagus taurus]|uniref:venom carboxylesterase-6-like n=1 Tax=Onthophagus taurus TaxID=166361 RepID=UPI000C20CE23|nr:venom carboxylesterase-6-like [Onthophagus taurus]